MLRPRFESHGDRGPFFDRMPGDSGGNRSVLSMPGAMKERPAPRSYSTPGKKRPSRKTLEMRGLWAASLPAGPVSARQEEERHGRDPVEREQLDSLEPVRLSVERNVREDRRRGEERDELDRLEGQVHRPDQQAHEHEQRGDEDGDLRG